MAKNLHLSVAARNAMLDALNSIVGASGLLLIKDGTQPANVAAADAGTVLATLALSATAFAAAASGAVALNTVTDDSSADNSGTATWFSIRTSGGTRVIEGNVGATGAGTDLELNSTTITAGQDVAVTGYSLNIAA